MRIPIRILLLTFGVMVVNTIFLNTASAMPREPDLSDIDTDDSLEDPEDLKEAKVDVSDDEKVSDDEEEELNEEEDMEKSEENDQRVEKGELDDNSGEGVEVDKYPSKEEKDDDVDVEEDEEVFDKSAEKQEKKKAYGGWYEKIKQYLAKIKY